MRRMIRSTPVLRPEGRDGLMFSRRMAIGCTATRWQGRRNSEISTRWQDFDLNS